MEFLDRFNERKRLDALSQQPRRFAAIWGRRRVGKSRLLHEWLRDSNGLYLVADQSVASIQRDYFATAVATRFSGFDETTYPNWDSFFRRLNREAKVRDWCGPVVIDEFPYLVTADPGILATLQHWLDDPERQVCVVVCGSSISMMRDAILNESSPLFGRTTEAFSLRPLLPGYLKDVFPAATPRELVSIYAAFGAMPRYLELAEPFGNNLEEAMDNLVLDPNGPLHREPDRLLAIEVPTAMSLRPLLDVIGNGSHRVIEIGARLERKVTSLSAPLASLVSLDLIRRETPFGSNPKSSKRSLYQIADPFLRLWFRVVAPNRALLARAPRETRFTCWTQHRRMLEAFAWEEICRMAVPHLHKVVPYLKDLGPFGLAQRYWRRNEPELDIVARSIDGEHVLIGEAKWQAGERIKGDVHLRVGSLPIGDAPIHSFLFTPDAPLQNDASIIDAETIFGVLR